MSQNLKSIKSIHINYSMENPSKPSETEWIESSTFIASLNEYDKNGNLIKASSYNQGNEIHEYYEYIYDSDNNLIEELCYFDENELAEHKFIIWNTDKLRISEKVIYMEAGSENITHFSYNSSNLLIEKHVVDHDNELEELDIYEYMNEKLILERKFDYENKPVYSKKYNYNKEGYVSDYEYSSPDPYEYVRYEYFYDKKGERIKTLHYNYKNQLIEKNLMEFDEKGNMIEMQEENQKSNKITRLYYDDNNNQIKQEEFNQNELLITSIERTFNSENKLIESLVYMQDPDDGVQQMYAYKYEYDYWQE